MDIKARSIRFGKSNFSPHEGDCFIMDEYGIQDEEIYHRNIIITEEFYEEFEINPYDDMLLDEFLEQNDIHSMWQRYEVNFPNSVNSTVEMEILSNLLNEIDSENGQDKNGELSEQTKSKLYKKLYNEFSKMENLIGNPLIIDVFNEAIKEDEELASWESVFPFFR